MAERDAPIRPSQGAGYYEDYAAWIARQFELMKAGRWNELDVDHVIDEFGSLARSDFDSLVKAVKNIIREMMQWDVFEDNRCQDGAASIEILRSQALGEISDSPSYEQRLGEAVSEAYQLARFEMSQEDKIPFRLFPEVCPYLWSDIIGRKNVITGEAEPTLRIYKS